jgi:hypothetical protein
LNRWKTIAVSKSQQIKKKINTAITYNYGTSANQIQMLNGHLLHQQNYTGSGKIIAVLDAGFPGVDTQLPFKKLRDNNQILGGYNYVNRSANYYTGDNHGTLVLSTMGGNQDQALVGTAPDASYYLFVTENDASENPIEETLWVEAAEKADSLGADIINSSLVLWRDVAAPDDTVIEEIANRQQSQMQSMDVPQFETDWLYVEQKKKKRGWQVLRTVALGFDRPTTEVV